MAAQLAFKMQPQPDNATCGPTCLHAVYDYYDDSIGLEQVIAEVPSLDEGGTLAVFLACHALRRGYQAAIHTYNLQLFDPTWFRHPGTDLRAKLEAQAARKHDPKLQTATRGYLDYLDLGGELHFEDLTTSLVRERLKRSQPILTGLSATFLYRDVRERLVDGADDDVGGYPAGHFVVLCGYDRESRTVLVADPLHPNPLSSSHIYSTSIDRVLNAILLGVLTFDANLLVLTPPKELDAKRPETK